MYSRIVLVLSALFWLTMNYLLWRSEFGGGNPFGTAVPLELVWRKILTAPDNSMLDVYHHGKKEGNCRWTVGTGQIVIPDFGEDMPPVERPAQGPGYRLSLEGALGLNHLTNRLQFDFDLRLTTNRDWQEVNLRLNVHQGTVAIHSVAAEKTVRLRTESDGAKDEQTFTFAQLQNPASLAQAFNLPVPLEMFGLPDLATNAPAQALPELGLLWTARNDRLEIGHAAVRVYRLESRLLDRYRAVIYLSPVGEILRVELPDGWVLVNDEAGVF